MIIVEFNKYFVTWEQNEEGAEMWEAFLAMKDKESILKRSNVEGDLQRELGFVHVENEDDPKEYRGIKT